MKKARLIKIGEDIRGDNQAEAERVRELLSATNTTMLNIMASPGAGKTSLIMRTLEAPGRGLKTVVIEADMDSQVDADRIVAAGHNAVQIHTGGFCHVDARMVMKTLQALNLEAIDILILENVGNLICPAQFDTGAAANIMILSVPEGDDKPLKYPLMFKKCDALVVNKIDFLDITDFDMKRMEQRVRLLNPDIRIFPISCRTGEGIDPWVDWVQNTIRS